MGQCGQSLTNGQSDSLNGLPGGERNHHEQPSLSRLRELREFLWRSGTLSRSQGEAQAQGFGVRQFVWRRKDKTNCTAPLARCDRRRPAYPLFWLTHCLPILQGVRAWETLLEFSSYAGTRKTRIEGITDAG